MKISALTAQQRDTNRINIMVDGKYRFSLDVSQVIDLSIRVGKEYTNEELAALEAESQFGKVYARTLEYCLMRPHSSKEVRDYLYRKTRNMHTKTGGVKKGVPSEVTVRVYDRLVARGYIDDEKFARYWIENRNLKKGMSRRKLEAELRVKGVDGTLIEDLLVESSRSETEELLKVIAKRRSHYPDPQKLMRYLARQGFSYDDIKQALSDHF